MIIQEKEVKSILSKSNLPIAGYTANTYIGCPHACKYCYADFMKRFTGHKEKWGTFLDVKYWNPIKNPLKYDGETDTAKTTITVKSNEPPTPPTNPSEPVTP